MQGDRLNPKGYISEERLLEEVKLLTTVEDSKDRARLDAKQFILNHYYLGEWATNMANLVEPRDRSLDEAEVIGRRPTPYADAFLDGLATGLGVLKKIYSLNHREFATALEHDDLEIPVFVDEDDIFDTYHELGQAILNEGLRRLDYYPDVALVFDSMIDQSEIDPLHVVTFQAGLGFGCHLAFSAVNYRDRKALEKAYNDGVDWDKELGNL